MCLQGKNQFLLPDCDCGRKSKGTIIFGSRIYVRQRRHQKEQILGKIKSSVCLCYFGDLN